MPSRSLARIAQRLVSRLSELSLTVLLPMAGLAAGVLAGYLAWGGLAKWVLDHRAEIRLRTGPQERAGEASSAVVGLVESEAFQKPWREAVGEHGADLQLQAEPETVFPRKGEVRLVCLGRPEGAVRRGLDAARDRITDPRPPRLELKSPNYDRDAAELAEKRAKVQRDLDALVEGEKRLRAEEAGTREAAAARLAQMRSERDQLGKKVAEIDGAKTLARRQAVLDELTRTFPPGGGQTSLSSEETARLRAEMARLQQILGAENLADCTPDHPIIKRMTEVAQRLKAADLADELTRINGSLDALEAHKAALAKVEAELKSAESKFAAEAERIAGELKGIPGKRAELDSSLSGVDADIRKLEAVPRTTVEIEAPPGRIVSRVDRGWMLWACLAAGLAAGLVLAALLRRMALSSLGHIDSAAALAGCLRAPVLGVVPMLADLAPHPGETEKR